MFHFPFCLCKCISFFVRTIVNSSDSFIAYYLVFMYSKFLGFLSSQFGEMLICPDHIWISDFTSHCSEKYNFKKRSDRLVVNVMYFLCGEFGGFPSSHSAKMLRNEFFYCTHVCASLSAL